MGCVSSKKQVIFGIPLVEVPRHDDYAFIPRIVVECIQYIERYGNIDTNGIYRISGSKNIIDKLIEKVFVHQLII